MTEKNKDKQDPGGLAPSRSQTANNVGQGQKSGSRPGEKGSPPEGERPPPLPRKVTLAVGREPTFYIGGGNGASLVDAVLTEFGWKRITDKYNENFKVKWVECKNAINYNSFKEGDQLVNHIPNGNLLTNKMGLLTSLQAYERLNAGLKRRETRSRLADFMPETYRLDDTAEREAFMEAFQANDIWICKPTGMNQGKGIYLVRDLDEFKVTLQERDERIQQNRRTSRTNMGRVIQKYIKKPLLLDGRKFDIRAYMLIAGTTPYLVLYHKGYVRLSLVDYDIQADSLTAHLTNQYIQKKDPTYQDEKESTAWSMDKFNDYVNEHVAPEKGLEENWVYRGLTTKMRQIMTYCFRAVKNRLHCKIGYFDLYGLDFMVDEDMKVYLIEVNVNPSLSTNCTALKEVIPGVVRESLHLSLECYEKARRGQALMPLQALDKFVVLHNGCTRSHQRAATATPTPRQSESSHSRTTVVPRRNVQSPTRRQPSNKDTGQGQMGTFDKGQSAPVRVKGTATPKQVLRGPLPITPTAPPPAFRGAVPLTEAAITAVTMTTAQSDQVKLKMSHSSGLDPTKRSEVKEAEDQGTQNQGQKVVLEKMEGQAIEGQQGEGQQSKYQPTQGQEPLSADLDIASVVEQRTHSKGHETPTKQIIMNARTSSSDSKTMPEEGITADTKSKGPDSSARTKALLSSSRTALRVAKVSLSSSRKTTRRSPERGN